jgi:alkylation response protein AidB-like acyl-CoA dehydrogenase
VTSDRGPALDDAVERSRVIADDVLFPAAQATDRAPTVPVANLDALREAKLLGLQGPVTVAGGLGADHIGARPVFEAIAGGCGATAFVWAQHHGAVRRVAGGDGPACATWLPRLCDGSTLAGIGFAYLRRQGPATVRASRIADGWRIDGVAPWITGWGLIEALVVMARTDEGSVVTVLLERPVAWSSLRAGSPQALAVMGATRTVQLEFAGAEVSEGDVVGIQSDEAWRRRDRVGSALPPAAPLGIAARAIRLLAEGAPSSGVAEAAAVLAEELDERRSAADAVSAAVIAAMRVGDGSVTEAVGLGAAERDRGLDLARRATDALVTASGGGAMSLDHPAQRLSREATFYLIQAQTRDLRATSLGRATRSRSGR